MTLSKKLFVLACAMMATTTYANTLHDYHAVKSAISEGKMIRIAINFAKCQAVKNTIPAVDGLGLFTPNEVIVASDGRIVASLTHFTLNDPDFTSHPTYQHVQYVLNADNHLKLTARVLNAGDFSALSDEAIVDCEMGSGAQIYD